MRLLGACHLANRHHILGVSLVLAALLTLSWLGMRHSSSGHRPVYVRMREVSGASATVSQVAAPYVSPADLLAGRAEFGHTSGRGVPMLIHQSWMNRDMPVKFKRWSDTWRAKHPDWKWVLWTDKDNARLVARYPEVEATYKKLKNGIQRADLVRNLYMWEFGGIYADLDMECLRNFNYLLDAPTPYLSASYHPSSSSSSLLSLLNSPSPSSASPSLAYVGSMEVHPGEWQAHGLPNAFFASHPRHPLWLFPLAHALAEYGVYAPGHKPFNNHTKDGAEDVTGPAALALSIGRYREYRAELEGQLASGAEEEEGERASASVQAPVDVQLVKALPPILHDMAAESVANPKPVSDLSSTPDQAHADGQGQGGDETSPATPPRRGRLGEHDTIILEDGVIYPFSWVAAVAGAGPDAWHCMAAEGTGWDPVKCLTTIKAYERSAHAITYWTHSWSQDDDQKHLGVAGSAD